MIGRTVLHYTIQSELGRGSFGRVYLALDEHTHRRVALKFLDSAHAEPDTPNHLRREARAVARLAHPGIVTLYGLEEASGEWFLVEELVDGTTLAKRLEQGPLDRTESIRLARQLSAALAHAHARGVLHRDLKPANILITRDGAFKIADFGIAQMEGGTTASGAGMELGTVAYTSPERIRGLPGDARSDLFSLGAVLFEAITGGRAFRGDTAAAVLHAVMNATPPFPRPRDSRLQQLVTLVERLMAKDPEERLASAELLHQLLGEIDRGHALKPARPARRALWIAAAAVAGLGVWVGIARWPNPGFTDGAVAVMPFRNAVDPADRQRLGVIASTFLETALGQASDVTVVSSERVLEERASAGREPASVRDERRLARRAGASLIVRGAILRLEPTVLATAEISDVSRGRVLGATQAEGATGQGFFSVIGSLGAHLLPLLPREGPRRGWPVPRGDSLDLVAYQYYVEGLELGAHGEYARAEDAFRHALDRDPRFPWAASRLAFIQWMRSQPGERVTP